MRLLRFATLAVISIPTVGRAQSEAVFTFYHGAAGASRLSVDDKGHPILNSRQRFDLVMRPGTDVCVAIPNAHPVNYRYSLESVVDTVKPVVPDLSVITSFLSGLPGYVQPDVAQQSRVRAMIFAPARIDTATAGIDPRLESMIRALVHLKAGLDSAQDAAKASDNPELFMEALNGKSAFGEAVSTIGRLSSQPYQFNDPKLQERHSEELKKISEWAKGTPERQVLADAFAASSALLLAARGKLRADYSSDNRGEQRLCKVIAAGKNTIRMSIASTATPSVRDTYAKGAETANPFQIEVESKYERKVASLDPFTFAAFSRDVPVFAIRNDTLRIDRVSNPTNVRPGLMLSYNPLALGPAEKWVIGAGLGVGYSSKDVISDLVGAATLSYENYLRIGIGVGRSSQPETVKGAVVGQPIPADFGALKDVVENGKLNSRSWYLLLSIPGFSIAKD